MASVQTIERPSLRNLTSLRAERAWIGAIVLVSALPFLFSLGFYSDDWSFLEYFSLSEDQSLPGLYQAANSPNTAMRPVQLLYLGLLYSLFGLNPLGYHVVNALVHAAGAVSFVVILRQLRIQPAFTISAALIFALLPHYATDRFWYAAFQANLSMLLYFVSLWAGLQTERRVLWCTISLVSMVASVLAYEVFLPFFVLNPIIRWAYVRKKSWKEVLEAGLSYLVLFGVVTFKVLSTTRAASDVALEYRIRWFAELIQDAYIVSFHTYGVRLPEVVWTLLNNRFSWPVVFAAIAVGSGTGLLLWKKSRPDDFRRAHMLRLFVGGLFLTGFGYAIFLTNFNAYISPAGIANRVAIASAVGVALAVTGAAGLALSFVPDRLKKPAFAIMIGLFCSLNAIVVGSIAGYWTEAYQQELRILDGIETRLTHIPAGSTILLDGVCPYEGPAVVFEANWDLAGALAVRYRRHGIKADVIAPGTRIRDDGVTTELYGSILTHYPYHDRFYIYHHASRAAHRVSNGTEARRYLAGVESNLEGGCPPGRAGYGVSVF